MKTLHLLTNKSRFDSLSLVCRQSDFAKFAISLVLFLCLGIGNVWGGTKQYTVSVPSADRHVQDDILITGHYTTAKFRTQNNQSVFDLSTASLTVISKARNIKSIAIFGQRKANGSLGNAFTVTTSSDAITFATPTSGFTAQRNGTPAVPINSLTNVQMVGNNQSQVTEIDIEFDSPVMAICLTRVSNTVIGAVRVIYDDEILPLPQLCEAHCTSTSAATGTGCTVTYSGLQSGLQISSLYYDKLSADLSSSGSYIRLDLGAGNTFQTGDEIWLDVNGNGLRGINGEGVKLNGAQSSSGVVTVLNKCTIPANMPMWIRYITQSTDPWVGSRYLYVGRNSDNSRIYSIEVHRDMWYVEGDFNSWSTSANPMTGSGTVSTTISLAANSRYEFKFYNSSNHYGNTGAIVSNVSGWEYRTDRDNCILYTGPAGEYTFSINTSTHVASVTYPVVDHPNANYVYFIKGGSWSDARIYNWDSSSSSKMSDWAGSPTITTTTTICGTTYYYCAAYFDKLKFRDGGSNESNNMDLVRGKYLDERTHASAWSDFTTYTISFNAGGGSGTMSSITGICPNDNQAIPANSFTKSAYTFANWTADVDVRVGGATVTAGSPIAGGATIQNINSDITLTAQWTIDPSIVEIPGTVDKSPAPTFGNGATWWADNADYINLNPTDKGVVTEYAEWNVYLSHPGVYAVSETGHYENGHQYRLELRSSGSAVASFETTATWDKDVTNDLTFDQGTTWDLSELSPGIYTLRVQNIMEWGEPKLKSITLSYCIPKVPNQTLYGDPGDAMRAYGTITDAVVTALDHIPSGAISTDGRTLTIGVETITAPETAAGTLTNIPKDCYPECSYVSNCVWRFKEWNTTDLKAIYIPTFEIGYNTNGGTINDDPYATWYEYTGREEDITELPMNVTKDGYLFAGWYQDESTKELFPCITGNYYGDYSGEWCLRAHWVLPCEEQRVITGVTLTSSSTYTTDGYDEEYIGTPLVTITGSGSANANVDDVAGDETGYELGAAGDMVFVTLGVGEFRVGDIVNVYITARNTVGRSGGSDAYLELFYKTEGGDIIRLTHIKNVSSAGKYSYTLPSDDVSDMTEAGAVSLGVYRKDGADGQNPCVYRVEVVGCRDLFFDDNNNTHVWNDPKNWAPTYHEIPSYYQAAHILKPCIVNIANAQAKYIELEKDAVKGHDGKLTINANAALAVEGTVKEARGESLYAVQASDLVILANSSNQGAFAHGDALGTTHATVQFYARGNGAERGDLRAATWQYMGVPFSDVSNAQSHYYDGWMCQWIENTVGNAGSNWKWIVNGNPLYPFTGYCLTQAAAKTYTNTGTLVPSTNRDLTVTYTTGEGYGYFGWNMFANSYMAPINIAAFEDGDFEGDVEKTIYLFNTGISDGTTAAQGEGAGAGQYVTIPVSSAGSMLPANQYIAPMQGFYILATAAGTHTVTLNYDRLVRKSDHSALSVGPNRAKKEDDEPMMARIIIDVKGVHFSDRLYVFENAEQTNGFDNGWDGWKFEGEAYAPQLMTRTGDLDLAVDVSPAFGGKRIAFRVGEDSEYTLHFSTTEEGLYLRDLSNDMETEITEGGTYTFMAFNTTTEERFEIIDRRAELPNGLDEIIDNTTYDILDMTVYTAEGRLVLHRTTDFNKPLNLSTGMYVIYLNTTAGTQVHKIIF